MGRGYRSCVNLKKGKFHYNTFFEEDLPTGILAETSATGAVGAASSSNSSSSADIAAHSCSWEPLLLACRRKVMCFCTMQRKLCLIYISSLPVVFLPRYHDMNKSFLLFRTTNKDSFLTEEDFQLATLVGIQRFCSINKGFFY